MPADVVLDEDELIEDHGTVVLSTAIDVPGRTPPEDMAERAKALLVRHHIQPYFEVSHGDWHIIVHPEEEDAAIRALRTDPELAPYSGPFLEALEGADALVLRSRNRRIIERVGNVLRAHGMEPMIEEDEGIFDVWVDAARFREPALKLLRADPTLRPYVARSNYGRDQTERPLPPLPPVPSWVNASEQQTQWAEHHRVPVGFENRFGLRFVLIPDGTFWMGTRVSEESREANETRHEVTLTKPYYLQTTEVTNRQFRRFMPEHDSGDQQGYSLDAGDQPVVGVSWDDALAFIAWLNVQDPGRSYRLPTEAEWERACRAGSQDAFWWGDSLTTEQANYDGNTVYGGGAKGPYRQVTLPVGSLPASPWGLHEVHGNVREWCSDRYDDRDYPEGSALDPRGPAEGASRVVRGGAYSDAAHLLRASSRAGVHGGEGRSYVGFRVAVTIPEK